MKGVERSSMHKAKYITWLFLVLIIVISGFWRKNDLLSIREEENSFKDYVKFHFELKNDDGHHMSEQDFLGKPAIFYFGFTYCPDICPTILGKLEEIIGLLGSDHHKFNFAFVTIDPARDSAKALKSYHKHFSSKITFLTGSESQIDEITKNFKVYYKKTNITEKNYLFDHSSFIYLLDKNGIMKGYISDQDDVPSAINKIKQLALYNILDTTIVS